MKNTITRTLCFIFFMFLCLTVCTTVMATQYYVNGTTGNDNWDGLAPEWDGEHGPKATIQAGIDVTSDLDTVNVADCIYSGTGNKNLDYGGKRITVRSENGPKGCVIDCGNDGRGFYFHNSESIRSVVEGFTIKKGKASGGAGIYCIQSSPTIRECIFSGNKSTSHGGGIGLRVNCYPLITDCTFSNNEAAWSGGGIMLDSCLNPGPPIVNCIFSGNKSAGPGGGIHSWSSEPIIVNCTFNGNESTDYDGGGIRFYYNFSSTSVTNCTFSDNSAVDGGGIYCESSEPTIKGCGFYGNTASGWGGGMFAWEYSTLTITNCVFSGNESVDGGGGIYSENNNSTITNSTFSGNESMGGGGGIYSYNSQGLLTVTNCILWGDIPEEIYAVGGSQVTYCDVEGGWAGEGNIDADPRYIDAAGSDDIYGTVDDDLRLRPYNPNWTWSPCIDAGDNSAVPSGVQTDILGNPRILDGDEDETATVDMGAYEFTIPGDIDSDCDVDLADLSALLASYGKSEGEEGYNPAADLNGDGTVDEDDYAELMSHYGETCP